MTIVVVNQAGGADFTDLQTAIDAAPSTLTEVYEIQLEPGTYVGDLVIPARAGESVNNYIKITHTTGNYATGFGLGAHITSSDGGHINTINGNFVVYEGISITNASITGNSDEAFRLLGTELLLQRCFVDAENDIRQQDAVYFGGAGDQSLTMSNCAVRGFSRNAVNMQRRIISSPTTYNLELFNNTFIDNGIQSTNQDDSGGISIDVTRDPSANLPLSAVVANINAYNNIVINTQGFNTKPNADTAIDILALEWRNLSGGNANEELATYNWIGGGNVSGQDDSAQEKFGVADNFANVGLVDTTPVAGENVFVTDVASNDYSIAGENAFTVTQNGVTAPNPTDPRVDLTVDILGDARPTIGTLGAFQFQTSELLIVDDASNSLISNSIDLVQSFTLAPADARIDLATDSVALSQGVNLATDDSVLSVNVENVDLLQGHVLIADENIVSVNSGNLDLTQAGTISVGDSTHDVAADALALTQTNVLPAGDTTHGLTVDTVTLDQSIQLPADDSTFAVTDDNVALTQANIVAAADSLIAATTDNVNPAQLSTLSVLGTTHSLQTATLQVAQGNLLQLANTVIATLIDNVDLGQAAALTVSDTLHGMLTDQITLTQGATVNPAKSFLSLLSAEALIEVANVLTVFSSAHNSTTDNAATIENSFLEIADLLNSVQTESVTISTGQILDLQGVTHLTSSDQFALTEAVILIAINNVHAVNVDDFDLGFAIVLPVETTIASTISNNIELTTSQLLAANNAINTIATDSLELLQNTSLIVSSVLHQHISTQLGLFSGDITTPSSRTIKIQRDNRIILILPDAPLH